MDFCARNQPVNHHFFPEKCAKVGRKFEAICLARIIMCKTIASPTLRYVRQGGI